MNRQQRFEAQIAHIREHQAKFDEHQGKSGASVADYFHDYGSYENWALYQNLCFDLEIEPRQEICHPNPED